MSDMKPSVSIIIPCRNEEKFIRKCIDSVLGNGYPADDMEILIIDGMSDDDTKRIVEEYASNKGGIRVLDNPQKIVSAAMNIGIRNAAGAIIIRLDAHNFYEKGYIEKCVRFLDEFRVDNVGGVCVTVPGDSGMMSRAIAIGLSNRFGVGNSLFRVGVNEPRYVETVPFGCYRREIFEKIGLFDEELVRNQDDEFNARLLKKGGKILLHPDIKSYYHARTSLKQLWRMYFQYGYFKPLAAQKVGSILTYRQLVPFLFILTLALSGTLALIFRPLSSVFFAVLFSYIAANIGLSGAVAVNRGVRYLVYLPPVFATLHFSYGLGFIKGLLSLALSRNKRARGHSDVPLTR